MPDDGMRALGREHRTARHVSPVCSTQDDEAEEGQGARVTYRDDIGQAHQRIAQLEEELAGERAKHAASLPRARSRRGPLGCIVPDGFRDGSAGLTILVEGELGHGGVFDATQVLVRFEHDF
jgi:hypothetical protein